MQARLGKEGVEVPASSVPCASCHGRDGLGRPEGGVIPTSITWGYLIKSYGHEHENGRKHPAFTAETVKQAITDGVDSAGNPLDAAMPRYSLSDADLTDLVAYLERLEADTDPGLTETAIRLGTILPTSGPLAELGQAMQAVLTAYFEEVNAEGGIYGRRIALEVAEPAGDPAATVANLERLLEQHGVFALVSAFTAGTDKQLAEFVENRQIPLVGPFTLFPQDSLSLNRFTFYLLSGLAEQARVLADYAGKELELQGAHAAVVHPQGQTLTGVMAALTEQGKNYGWKPLIETDYPRGALDVAALVRTLKDQEIGIVFFFGAGSELAALAREAQAFRWTPYLFLPGALVDKHILELPAGFKDRLFLGYPTVPSHQTPMGIQDFNRLREKYRLPPRHTVAQLTVYSAAKVLVQGLKLAGKDFSREKLVGSLESLYQFDTGVIPSISYGPNRRVGALRA